MKSGGFKLKNYRYLDLKKIRRHSDIQLEFHM